MKKVMLFGVFDGLHEGHKELLKEARKYGDYVVVVVAQDHIVSHLKGHEPKFNLADRIAHLEEVDGVDEVVIGDRELSTWEVAKKYRPDVVLFGYDQDALRQDFATHAKTFDFHPETYIAREYESQIFHSEFLNK